MKIIALELSVKWLAKMLHWKCRILIENWQKYSTWNSKWRKYSTRNREWWIESIRQVTEEIFTRIWICNTFGRRLTGWFLEWTNVFVSYWSSEWWDLISRSWYNLYETNWGRYPSESPLNWVCQCHPWTPWWQLDTCQSLVRVFR